MPGWRTPPAAFAVVRAAAEQLSPNACLNIARAPDRSGLSPAVSLGGEQPEQESLLPIIHFACNAAEHDSVLLQPAGYPRTQSSHGERGEDGEILTQGNNCCVFYALSLTPQTRRFPLRACQSSASKPLARRLQTSFIWE